MNDGAGYHILLTYTDKRRFWIYIVEFRLVQPGLFKNISLTTRHNLAILWPEWNMRSPSLQKLSRISNDCQPETVLLFVMRLKRTSVMRRREQAKAELNSYGA